MGDPQDSFLRNHYKGADGLREILRSTKAFNDQVPRKLRGMQSRYLERYSSQYDPQQRSLMEYYLEAFLYKEFSSDWITEQIWAIVRTGSGDPLLTDVLANSLDIQNTSDVDAVALSLLLDNFLVQTAAFIDFYLLYLLMFFRKDFPKRILNWEIVRPMLEEVSEPLFDVKGREILNYFDENVFQNQQVDWESFSIKNWGNVVTSLRHKVVHRDRDLPILDQGESFTSKLMIDWPNDLKRIGCARFCEDVRGDMFSMVSKLAEVLYSERWEPGR